MFLKKRIYTEFMFYQMFCEITTISKFDNLAVVIVKKVA